MHRPVLINKYKVNLGTKVKNKQARGTIIFAGFYVCFSVLFTEQTGVMSSYILGCTAGSDKKI